MKMTGRQCLLAGAWSSGAAALLHLGCALVGAEGYRLLGAGERMAGLAEQGHWYPLLVTWLIASILAVWTLYALSGAGVIRRLPWLRSGLSGIAAVYLLRGVAFPVIMPAFPENSMTFWIVTSFFSLSIGGFYAVGTYRLGAELSYRQEN